MQFFKQILWIFNW